jgi:dTMP kinase
MTGKLVIIEGGDGSGKATQTKLLVEYLQGQKIPVETLSFPRYSNSFYGNLVGRFLSGEFGSLDSVSPYLAAIPYALDRLDARDEINKWLEAGKVVVIDRYVPSSLAHQAAKVSQNERDELVNWLEKMEYEENKLPRPDLVVYLHVPVQESLKLIEKRREAIKEDISETKSHQEKAEEMFLRLAREKGWQKIDCVNNGNLLTIPEIHTQLLQILRTSLNIDEVQ